MKAGAIYADTRVRISDLARQLSADELATPLPACPAWTVRDVIGHLTGLIDDATHRRLAGLGTDEWTMAQVNAHRAKSLEQVLADWAQVAAAAEADLEGTIGPMGIRLVSDAWTHEQDIRGALGRPGAREDNSALAPTLAIQTATLGERLDAAGLPGIALRGADGLSLDAGSAPPGITLRVPTTWHYLRAVTSRRSRAQVSAMQWEGAPAVSWLEAFFRFAPAEGDILE
jgi:uncharacterized protein (TIGR03083 family)